MTGRTAGAGGTYVISWAQTEVDGVSAAPIDTLMVGAAWRWHGEALRLDGPGDLLLLTGAVGEVEIRRRAAHSVRRLLGAAVSGRRHDALGQIEDGADQSFVVTDGYRAYTVTLVDAPESPARLAMFSGAVPPRGADLWVVDRMFDPRARVPHTDAPAVICFTPGTLIATPRGPRTVESLRPGERVSTRDDGAQPILWVGGRRMTGARLYAMPELRPVRFRAGALGIGRPDADLLVSPQHRMLVRSAATRALFNEPEVLVSARDLVNSGTVRIEQSLREVCYIHLLFERHQILRANGLESESFHPGATTLEMIAPAERAGLLMLLPYLAGDPAAYGSFARRRLRTAEAAILRHEMAA